MITVNDLKDSGFVGLIKTSNGEYFLRHCTYTIDGTENYIHNDTIVLSRIDLSKYDETLMYILFDINNPDDSEDEYCLSKDEVVEEARQKLRDIYNDVLFGIRGIENVYKD